MFMRFVRNLKTLLKEDIGIAGGKGASLGEMKHFRVLVPDGYLILSAAYNKFIKDNELDIEIDAALDEINYQEMQTIENASEKIKVLILTSEIPEAIEKEIIGNFDKLKVKRVAIRSSATLEDSVGASWAGQLDSYINTTKKDLIKNIKRCWASLFSPRAIFYKFRKNLNGQEISMAVVMQKMINSEVSGIAFSVDPITQDRNQIIIEAGFGLGEAIVSGKITPDAYFIKKQPLYIMNKNISEQKKALVYIKNKNKLVKIKNGNDQKLQDRGILKLAKVIIKIEAHFGFPCDIEWTMEKGKLYVTQSRFITTLIDER